jgi:hypothetical protein
VSRKEAYQFYLKSAHWRALRKAAFRFHGYKCSKCPCSRRLQVHHHTYRFPWTSCTVADVVPICRDCHRKEHGITREPPVAARKPHKPVKTSAQLAKKAKNKAERQARSAKLLTRKTRARRVKMDRILNAKAGNSHWIVFPTAPLADVGAELDPAKATVAQPIQIPERILGHS